MATLKIARAEAEDLLVHHGDQGSALRKKAQATGTDEGYRSWELDRKRWIGLTADALLYIYDGDEEAAEFQACASPHEILITYKTWQEELRLADQSVQDAVNTLVSLAERLKYAIEPTPKRTDVTRPRASVDPDGPIFIVHGHDSAARESVARVLERSTGRETVILHERPNKGRTLLEKFESKPPSWRRQNKQPSL
jgi:hypothetical protein